MANDTNVRGLLPLIGPTGNIRVGYYRANTAIAIYRNQIVAINNSGQVATIGTGGNTAALGVAIGFLDANRAGLPTGLTVLPNSLGGTSYGPFLPSSTDAYVAVTDDPQQQYLIEEDTAGTALTVNSAGQVCGWTYQATTGNTTTGYATITLVRSDISSGTAGLLQLLDPYNILNQDGTVNAPGNYCKWVVRIANHQLGGTKLGAAQG